jgi:cyclic pyranopterin phosphate synthase
LTADGKLRPCLGRHGEIDLRDQWRAGLSSTEALREAIARKPEAHEFREHYQPGRPMTAIGG